MAFWEKWKLPKGGGILTFCSGRLTFSAGQEAGGAEGEEGEGGGFGDGDGEEVGGGAFGLAGGEAGADDAAGGVALEGVGEGLPCGGEAAGDEGAEVDEAA